jgi:hypothetical protein
VLTAQTGLLAELDAYSAQIRQIDDLLADARRRPVAGAAAFFKRRAGSRRQPVLAPGAPVDAVGGAGPGRPGSRALDTRLNEIRDGWTPRSPSVTEINSYATQLAEINQRIIKAQGGSPAASRPTTCSTSATS